MVVSGPKVVVVPSPPPKFRIGEVVGHITTDGILLQISEIVAIEFSETTRWPDLTRRRRGYSYRLSGRDYDILEKGLVPTTSNLLLRKFGMRPFGTLGGGRVDEEEEEEGADP